MSATGRSLLIGSSLLFFLCSYATCLIIPEELPTLLSLIYSNIPPIKKGTDSRLGVGFRLGQHADFQVLVELGPQTETDPIGASTDSKRRRDATFSAAMKGELGPFAQAVAKYQMERKLRRELERLKKLEETLEKVKVEESDGNKTSASEWLSSWSKEIAGSTNGVIQRTETSVEKSSPTTAKGQIVQTVSEQLRTTSDNAKKISDLQKLYKLQANEKKDQVA